MAATGCSGGVHRAAVAGACDRADAKGPHQPFCPPRPLRRGPPFALSLALSPCPPCLSQAARWSCLFWSLCLLVCLCFLEIGGKKKDSQCSATGLISFGPRSLLCVCVCVPVVVGLLLAIGRASQSAHRTAGDWANKKVTCYWLAFFWVFFFFTSIPLSFFVFFPKIHFRRGESAPVRQRLAVCVRACAACPRHAPGVGLWCPSLQGRPPTTRHETKNTARKR